MLSPGTLTALAAYPEVQDKVYLELAALGLAPVRPAAAHTVLLLLVVARVEDIDAQTWAGCHSMQVGQAAALWDQLCASLCARCFFI